jgi:uncharacterized protein YndB with AHSA1/START domain
MNITIKPAPVRKSVVVQASQLHAFKVFTTSFKSWWPATHSINKSPQKEIVLEPHVGGRWYEVGEDGSQCLWGKVLVWEPPSRLVLAWQIGADWQYHADLITEVEIKLTAEGPKQTRVELEHRLLERMGEDAQKMRDTVDSEGGWGTILSNFAKVAAGESR